MSHDNFWSRRARRRITILEAGVCRARPRHPTSRVEERGRVFGPVPITLQTFAVTQIGALYELAARDSGHHPLVVEGVLGLACLSAASADCTVSPDRRRDISSPFWSLLAALASKRPSAPPPRHCSPATPRSGTDERAFATARSTVVPRIGRLPEPGPAGRDAGVSSGRHTWSETRRKPATGE
jgi:hypothetical protein